MNSRKYTHRRSFDAERVVNIVMETISYLWLLKRVQILAKSMKWMPKTVMSRTFYHVDKAEMRGVNLESQKGVT